jgi:hypothetical protein
MVTEKVKKLRETYGFLPDEDLYEFAELLFENICKEFQKQNVPLMAEQQEILTTYIVKRK